MFDHHLLDMIELGVTGYSAMKAFKVLRNSNTMHPQNYGTTVLVHVYVPVAPKDVEPNSYHVCCTPGKGVRNVQCRSYI